MLSLPIPPAARALATVVALAAGASAQSLAPTPTSPTGARRPLFEDVTDALGVSFVHKDFVASGIGSGSGWIDFDVDGDEDLLIASADGNNALFRNDVTGFVDVTSGSGIDTPVFGFPMGVSVADYDQDGLPDAYLTTDWQNALFRNLGNDTFADVAATTGVQGATWSAAASWADFDLDGDLDLYVGNYVSIINFPYNWGAPNRLYENVGPGTPFVDVAAALGVDGMGVFGPSVPGFPFIAPTGQPTAGCTLSVSTLDHDEDGDPDLFEGNDFGQWTRPNTHWRNDQSGGVLAFTDVTAASAFGSLPHYNMGVAPADFDLDGDWDLYLSNLGDNLLFQNDGGVYSDVAPSAGPVEGLSPDGVRLVTSWASAWVDLDSDGLEDLLIVNGHVPSATFIANEVRSPNHAWRNLGNGTFDRVPPVASGFDELGAGRGMAVADFDRDGRMDAHIVNNGGIGIGWPNDRCVLLRNTARLANGATNGWLQLALAGRLSNLEGIGARIEVDIGAATQRRQVLADNIFLSSSTRIAHVGLGAAPVADEVRVHWPSGVTQRLLDVGRDQRLTLTEPYATVFGVDSPTWSSDVLTLAATLASHDTFARTASATFRVELPSGPTLFTATIAVPVAPGTTVPAVLPVPLPASLRDPLVGLALVLVVTAETSGGVDQLRLAFTLP